MADFVVSARKYRPKRFDEVVGQDHVTTTLKSALQQDQLAHAFLFCGPRGIGKTTCARILAKVINCKNKTEDFEPCGTCDSCVSFQKNASFNISELDAASNNSVENIRSLVDQVRIPPQSGKYKVYIIDEVHMLSTSAFNAFLKTLEEPPPYAIFILATTEKHKILPTILSRCQIYDFKRISVPEISAHLTDIAVQEGVRSEPMALHVIAEKSDGSLRDALSLFDRLSSGSKGDLKYEQVISQLNILDYDVYFKMTEALLLEDAPSILIQFDEILQKGFEPDVFLLGISEHLRNLLVLKDQETVHLLEVSNELKDRYTEQAFMCSNSMLVSALDLLNECDIHYRMARNKRLHVEIALIKLTHIQRLVKSDSTPPPPEKKTEPSTPLGVSKYQKEKSNSTLEKPTKKETIPSEDSPILEEKPEHYADKQPVKREVKEENSGKKGKDKMLIGPKLKETKDIVKAVQEETRANSSKENKLNLENLQKLWKAYADETNSPSLKASMETALLSCEDDHVQVMVGSSVAKNLIVQENYIVEKIRMELNARDLSFEVHIDGSMNVDNETTIRPRSPQEKYDFFVDKNPLVEKLVQSFHLKHED